jgi:hypothetical protein
MKNLCLAVFLLASIATYAQNRKTENLVIITLDGYRWKELFTGADSFLVVNKKFMPGDSTALVKKYWATTPQERRKMLMPFVWTTVAKDGQLYGNRTVGNNVNVKNKYWFSYPGYNEIFTGYPDSAINSNDYPPNPNVNVLEYINKQSTYKNKVAVFASWNAYYRILNEERSGLYINAGWSELKDSDLNATQKTLNEQQAHLPHIFGETERLDGSTYALATEYLKKNHPKVLYLAFIDTDAFGHQLEEAVERNAAAFRRKSHFYYSALTYSLISAAPYLVCLGFHIAQKEDAIHKVSIVNQEEISNFNQNSDMPKGSRNTTKSTTTTTTTTKLPGVDTSKVIPSSPTLIKENSHTPSTKQKQR